MQNKLNLTYILKIKNDSVFNLSTNLNDDNPVKIFSLFSFDKVYNWLTKKLFGDQPISWFQSIFARYPWLS
jgi:hypothetical protein